MDDKDLKELLDLAGKQVVPLFKRPNGIFLEIYEPYIRKEWARRYFKYDLFKAKYKALKEQSEPDLAQFDSDFFHELQRVDWFIISMLKELEDSYNTIDQKSIKKDHYVELFVRNLYGRSVNLEKFFELNFYVICKITKKFEKLIDSKSLTVKSDHFPSVEYLNKAFATRIDKINVFTQKCVDLYSVNFRQKYPALAFGELKFIKNKNKNNNKTKFLIGIKLGIIFMIMLWMLVDTETVGTELEIWEQPGLFVYTSIGNLLLFRLCWACNTKMWAEFGVNYITVFQFEHDLKPNFLLVLAHTSTQFLFFFINFLLFFEFNTKIFVENNRNNPFAVFLSNGFPALLVINMIIYEVYEYVVYVNSGFKTSRGLFTQHVLYDVVRIFWTHITITFHASYVANMMTTFTKVYSDFLHALCWVISGSFLLSGQTVSNYGSSWMQCNSLTWHLIIAVFQIIPQFMRMFQQFHQLYDTGLVQYKVNACKYMLTVVVIVYGLFEEEYHGVYLILACILASFKWFWDCYMNWGMFEVMPNVVEMLNLFDMNNDNPNYDKNAVKGYWFLRKTLMFHNPLFYYMAIVVNFVLRFAWVMSLLPPGSTQLRIGGEQWEFLTGTKLSFFLASMEICRRSLWGLLRCEYEHLKFVSKKTTGFVAIQKHKYTLTGSKSQTDLLTYKDSQLEMVECGNRSAIGTEIDNQSHSSGSGKSNKSGNSNGSNSATVRPQKRATINYGYSQLPKVNSDVQSPDESDKYIYSPLDSDKTEDDNDLIGLSMDDHDECQENQLTDNNQQHDSNKVKRGILEMDLRNRQLHSESHDEFSSEEDATKGVKFSD